MQIKFIARYYAEQLAPRNTTALIAIIDPDKGPISTWEQWKYKILVRCRDIDPLKLSDNGQTRENRQPFTHREAMAIVEFIRSLPPRIDTIIAHCEAGISRSAAVAVFLHEKFPSSTLYQSAPLYNRYIRAVLDAVWEGGKATRYDP